MEPTYRPRTCPACVLCAPNTGPVFGSTTSWTGRRVYLTSRTAAFGMRKRMHRQTRNGRHYDPMVLVRELVRSMS